MIFNIGIPLVMLTDLSVTMEIGSDWFSQQGTSHRPNNPHEHKYEIVIRLQKMTYIRSMNGNGVNDTHELRKAGIGITVGDTADAARGALDIMLTEPGLSIIINVVLTSRAIFQRMNNYTIYDVSIPIQIVLGLCSLLIFANLVSQLS